MSLLKCVLFLIQKEWVTALGKAVSEGNSCSSMDLLIILLFCLKNCRDSFLEEQIFFLQAQGLMRRAVLLFLQTGVF